MINWNFPSNNNGDINGISNAGIETFRGAPYESLAREICQNSLDAKFDNKDKVYVEFSLFKYKTKDLPGYDVLKEWIPVVPAQHYFMGGIWVDSDSKTSMDHLYAVGETSCNGVHGANRLASNSLLESLVFAKRAARKICGLEQTVKPVDFSESAAV